MSLRTGFILLVWTFGTSSNLNGQDSIAFEKHLAIQPGYFKSEKSPSIEGFRVLNIGFIKSKNDRLKHGFELIVNLGYNTEIEEYSYYFDSLVTLTGGNQRLLEVQTSFMRFKNIKTFNRSQFGYYYSIGTNFEHLNTNPTPYGEIRDQKLYSLRFGINPYLNFHVSKSLNILCDFSFLQILQGYETSRFENVNLQQLNYQNLNFDMNFFRHVHLGISLNLN